VPLTKTEGASHRGLDALSQLNVAGFQVPPFGQHPAVMPRLMSHCDLGTHVPSAHCKPSVQTHSLLRMTMFGPQELVGRQVRPPSVDS
jgi:hypothetical protein